MTNGWIKWINNKMKAPQAKEISIAFGSHDIKLKGKVFLPHNASPDAPVPGAVLCHGFGASHKAVEPSARIMASQGVATIVFDFRGHGSSDGVVDGKMVEDIIDAWNLLSQLPQVDKDRIGLVGHSLGAISAIAAAEKLGNPKALVALSCPPEVANQAFIRDTADISQWSRHHRSGITEYPKHGPFPWLKGIAAFISQVWMYLFGYRVRVNWERFAEVMLQINMADVLQGLEDCSKLFVFCEGDTVTPYHQSILAYEAACEPKQMVLSKGGFHTTPLWPGSLRTRWTNWAIKTLMAE